MEASQRPGAAFLRAALAWSRWVALAPLALALLVLVTALALARLVEYDGRDLRVSFSIAARADQDSAQQVPAAERSPRAEPAAAPLLSIDRYARELRARIVWALSALGLTLALLCSVVFAFGSMLLELPRRHHRWVGAAALGILGLSVWIWLGERVVLPGVLHSLVEDLSPAVKEVRELSKGAGCGAITSMLLALCVLLAPGERSAAAVSARIAGLRRWMYVAATLLVAGLLEVGFLLHWPAARLDEVEAAAVAQLAAAVTTAAGTLLSILLALTYGSAAWLLRERALTLAPEVQREEWLKESGFGSSLGQHLVRVFALLAPLVAGGPLTALLDALT